MNFNPARHCYLLIILVQFALHAYAQTGGGGTYAILNLSTSARVAALGNKPLALKDGDFSTALLNPAALDSTMHRNLMLGFVDYFAGINYGTVAYARNYGKYGTCALTAQYIHYGSFEETDYTGAVLGKFSARDYLMQLGWGRPFRPDTAFPDSLFSAGANLKLLYSSYYGNEYSSLALATDLAVSYHNTRNGWVLAALVRNAGVQLKAFRKGNREKIPIEILFSASQKLRHAPLRLFITAGNLQKWDLTYKDPAITLTTDPLTGDTVKPTRNIPDKLMRHVVLGGEVLITNHFHLRFAYNYLRRKELQVTARRGLSGFSFGAGVRVYKFHIGYGRVLYHLSGGSNHISITTNLSAFYRQAIPPDDTRYDF